MCSVDESSEIEILHRLCLSKLKYLKYKFNIRLGFKIVHMSEHKLNSFIFDIIKK